jgi:hypothetical protein
MLTSLREAPQAVVELFSGTFRRDVSAFFSTCRIDVEPVPDPDPAPIPGSSPEETLRSLASPPSLNLSLGFQIEGDAGALAPTIGVRLFGSKMRISRRDGQLFTPQDRRLIRSIGTVLELRCHFGLQWAQMSRLELNRGVPEDHYIAACVEPAAYAIATARPSRAAATILTLRTMALSTYENRRISTGALLLGPRSDASWRSQYRPRLAPPEALRFGVELTSLKSLHRLCDGRRSVFLVDPDGKLADLVDIRHFAGLGLRREGLVGEHEVGEEPDPLIADGEGIPCARAYEAHALATRVDGNVCLVLSPNQEIRIFAGGAQEFVFAHGRWRVLDPAAKFAVWRRAVPNARLARVLFQTALDLAECRQGGLLVVATDPSRVVGHLVASHDLLHPIGVGAATETEASSIVPDGPTRELGSNSRSEPELWASPDMESDPEMEPGAEVGVEPPAKRALHYLARGRSATELDPPILEALAALDGALVTDPAGMILAFGAILRNDASCLGTASPHPSLTAVEGARTTAAFIASRFGPVLKISEDGVVSCFLDGRRAWDL